MKVRKSAQVFLSVFTVCFVFGAVFGHAQTIGKRSESVDHSKESMAKEGGFTRCPPPRASRGVSADAPVIRSSEGGGDDIPTPFSSANLRVELADGETYSLIGIIRMIDNKPWFEVDLEEHPWLANVNRRVTSRYPLEGVASYFNRFDGIRVLLVAEAHGVVVSGAHYVIRLAPLVQPKALSFHLRDTR